MDSNEDDLPAASSSSGTARGKERAHPEPVLPSATSSTSAATPSQSQSQNQSQLSKRRRGIGVVTPNACNECRKKRVKCDGRRPCGRCRMQRDVECVYELPVRQSKEDLRSEIEALRRRQRSSEIVLSALNNPDIWQYVLQRLHGGESVDNISEWIDSGAPPPPPTASASASGSVPAHFQRPMLNTFSNSAVATYPPFSPDVLSPVVPGQGGPSSGGAGSGGAGSGHSLNDQQSHMNYPQQQQHSQQPPPPPPPLDSPWGGDPYSGASQATSGQSDSRQEWTAAPQSRVGSWVENTSPHDHGSASAGDLPSYRGLDHVLGPTQPDLKSPLSTTWTDISSDLNLVQHLLALYFCWEYPTFASLSKEHFLRDFQDARQRYCSPILVNALLALGCRFSTQPHTRAVPSDPHTSGDHFFKESQRLFYLEDDHHNLTTIQALGIMSIREASCGRDSESWYYAGQSVRLAIEMGLHTIRGEDCDDDEIAVKAATFWGAFALDHAWSLATGSLPQCSCFPILPPKPSIIDDIEASLWVPYTDDGAPLQRSCQQPSNVRSVYKCFCELSELVHQSLYVLHSPGRPLTSRDLLHIYTKYLNWYDSIPEVLRLGHNFTPAVLFAHMYYHFAILLLFRPLIKLRIIGSSIRPRDVCLQAADAIQGLLRSYSQLYTLQRTPSFVPYFVLTSSIMHLAIGAAVTVEMSTGEDITGAATYKETELAMRPKGTDDYSRSSAGSGCASGKSRGVAIRVVRLEPHVADSIKRGIADLTEMVPCHHFAAQALSILRYLAKKWNIDVQIQPVTKSTGTCVEETDHEQLRPLTTSLNFFAPNIKENDFDCHWGTVNESSSKGVPSTESIASSSHVNALELDNPLFWPFPMQGRPMLPSGKNLEAAGFAVL